MDYSESITRPGLPPITRRRFGFPGLRIDGWKAAAILIALLMLTPVLVIIFSLFSPFENVWEHILQNVLSELILNTVILVVGVSAGTLVLGVSLGWLIAAYDFPGRKIFSFALLLPMAVPAYVMAFVYLGLLDFTGPIQVLINTVFPESNYHLTFGSSRFGVIMVMTLALYPYIYLFARSAFMTQGTAVMEAARIMGQSNLGAFFRVALPMARPWIAGGLMLVAMETVADFGAVSIFNYNTFTTAIYKAWFGFFSLKTAAQLSSFLLIVVAAFIYLEQWLRKGRNYSNKNAKTTGFSPIALKGPKAYFATGFSSLVLFLAFIAPAAQLTVWAARTFNLTFDSRYLGLVSRTIFLGLAAAILTLAAALVLVYAKRLRKDFITSAAAKTATLGYALPGTVLAVGIFIPVAWLDRVIMDAAQAGFGLSLTPIIQGTILVMLAAYLVRFMAGGFNAVDSAMKRINPSMDEAARLMEVKGFNLLKRVHLPMLRSGIVTGLILVFVDVMKEMPITLMTRPFGWDTLAVKIFEYTSEGEWEMAAMPALALVLAGLIPVVLLIRQSEKGFSN